MMAWGGYTGVVSSLPQPRGPKVIAAIMDATVEEISEKGYPALSIESVAQRAGVNKTTVYRRWPTKGDLALAALAQEGSELFADPDTGSVEQDFVVVARRLSAVLRTKRGRALYMVLLQDRLGGGDLRTPPTSRREAHAIVERGIARGDLPVGTDPELVTGTLFGAVIQQALFENERPTDDFFRRLVAFVIAGTSAVDARRARQRRAKRSPAG